MLKLIFLFTFLAYTNGALVLYWLGRNYPQIIFATPYSHAYMMCDLNETVKENASSIVFYDMNTHTKLPTTSLTTDSRGARLTITSKVHTKYACTLNGAIVGISEYYNYLPQTMVPSGRYQTSNLTAILACGLEQDNYAIQCNVKWPRNTSISITANVFVGDNTKFGMIETDMSKWPNSERYLGRRRLETVQWSRTGTDIIFGSYNTLIDKAVILQFIIKSVYSFNIQYFSYDVQNQQLYEFN